MQNPTNQPATVSPKIIVRGRLPYPRSFRASGSGSSGSGRASGQGGAGQNLLLQIVADFQAGDKRAERQLERAFQAPLKRLAYRLKGRSSAPVDDLVMTGWLGICKALRRYEVRKGDLEWWAMCCASSAMRHSMRDDWNLIREPAYIYELRGALDRAWRDKELSAAVEARDIPTLSRLLRQPANIIEYVLENACPTLYSADAPVEVTSRPGAGNSGESEGLCSFSRLDDANTATGNFSGAAEARSLLWGALESLDGPALQLMRLIYAEGCSLRVASAFMNLSPYKGGLLQQQALLAMREYLEARGVDAAALLGR